MEARAEARYMRVSPQKARLVVDLIRGKRAEEALNILRFTRKGIAGAVEKLLRSAIANASERFERLDVDTLYVVKTYVNDGPRQKRIRPAPMGRAYRYQRRTSHIAIYVGDRQAAGAGAQPVARAAAPVAAATPAARSGKKASAGKAAGKSGGRPTARPSGKVAGKSAGKSKAAPKKTDSKKSK